MDDESPKEDRKLSVVKRPRSLLLLLVFTLVAVMLLYYGRQITGSQKVLRVDPPVFEQMLAASQVEEITLEGLEVDGRLVPGYKQDGRSYSRVQSEFPPDYFKGGQNDYAKLWGKLKDPSKFHYNPPNVFFYQVVLPFIPWIVLILLAWYFFFRQIRATGGPGNVLGFGKSRARFISPDKVKTTFDDVAGIDEAKEDVREIIDFLRDPQKFQRLGGRIPHGVLLIGPPGTGKTLLAKAIAGEARVPFLSICGSDFVEMFVGVGAARVRDLFKQAKENAPCIIFLDEIDAVGRRRGTGLGGGHDEREQTLNQILVEMDGFETDQGVIVMAATNRPDVLDPALLRPGRFDRQVTIELPDIKGREDILRVHVKKIKLGKEVDLRTLAKSTPMFSGADLAAVINEAAIIATLKKKDLVDGEDLEEARDKVLWGRQKKSRVMEESEKRVTAIHEAGHTLVAILTPHSDPVHKVTIIPRGPALGSTMTLPDRDRYHTQKKYCEALLVKLFGGRVAEELLCTDISAGAQDDIHKATELARRMVCEWGMSQKMGPLSYVEPEEHIFLGREITRTHTQSEQTLQDIDVEVRRIVDEAYGHAKNLIRQNLDKLEKITQGLLKYETLTGEEVKRLVSGEAVDALRKDEPILRPVPDPEAKKEAVWKPVSGEQPLPGPSQA